MRQIRLSLFRIIPFLLLLFSSLSIASESDSLVDAAWKSWNENKRSKVEEMFHAAIQKDENNIRAYLGLTFLYTLQEQHEKAWDVYSQVIKREADPYPYLYAAWVMPLFRTHHDPEKAGIIDVLQKLTIDTKAPPIMRAMAYENLGEYYEKRNKISRSNECYDGMNAITDWKVLGAFDNTSACGYDAVFPPEAEYRNDAVYEGKLGAPAKWFKVTTLRRDRWIDFKRCFAHSDAVFFANNFVYSPVKQKVHIRVGTSGSVKTFLNDELIIAIPDENNNDLDTYTVLTELQQGWNRVLIKCGYSEISNCNFMLRITDLKGFPLPDIKISVEQQQYQTKPAASVQIMENFAERYFYDQIQNYPEHMENYFLLAYCYLHNDKAAEAEDILRRGLAKLPQCSMFYYSLIETYNRGEKGKETTDLLEMIGTLDETIPSFLMYRYAQYIENEQYDEAEQMIRELNSVLPKSEYVYSAYIGLFGKKEQIDKIIAYNDEAYKLYPKNWQFAQIQSQIVFETTKNYQTTIDVLQDYLSKEYTDQALNLISSYYLQWGKLEKYDEIFHEMLKLDPAAPGYYDRVSQIFVKAQQFDKAETYLKKSLEICPSSAYAWEKLGNCYRMMQKPREAIDAYRKALLFSPTLYDSREALRELENQPPIYSIFPSTSITKLKRNSVEASDYPEDQAIFLLDDTKRIVYPEGASEYTREIALKAFNSRGVDDLKEYTISYNSYSETLNIEKAVVIKAKDQSEVKADIDRNHIVFKSLEEGDVIYAKWRIKNYYAGKMSKQFWDRIFFNGFLPKKLVRYSLLVPMGISFDYTMQQADIKPAIDTLGDGIRYTWTMENLQGLIEEYGMPPLSDIGIVLSLSTIPNWDYIVQWYTDIARDKTRSSFEIKEQVAALFAGTTNPYEKEKIRTIYNFITEKIRYSSVSFRQSSFVPQRARDVLVHRLGDCKDMATLCIAMLKEIGITSYYVLLNTRDEGLNRNILPSLEFNHCIVGVETSTGIKYLDLTANNTPMGSVPYWDQDAFALLIKPGTNAPIYMTDEHFMPSNYFRNTNLTLDAGNSAKIKHSTMRIGSPSGHFRDNFRNKGTKDIEKEIMEILTSNYPTVKLLDYEFKNLDAPEDTLYNTFTYSVPDYATETAGLKIIKVNWTDKLETNQALSYTQRMFPYNYYSWEDTTREDVTIMIPAGYRPIEMKPAVKLKTIFGDYSITYSYSKGVIRGRREFIHKKKIISPSEYKDFKKFYEKIMKEDEKAIVLKKGKE